MRGMENCNSNSNFKFNKKKIFDYDNKFICKRSNNGN